jgi:hypothetical protein
MLGCTRALSAVYRSANRMNAIAIILRPVNGLLSVDALCRNKRPRRVLLQRAVGASVSAPTFKLPNVISPIHMLEAHSAYCGWIESRVFLSSAYKIFVHKKYAHPLSPPRFA